MVFIPRVTLSNEPVQSIALDILLTYLASSSELSPKSFTRNLDNGVNTSVMVSINEASDSFIPRVALRTIDSVISVCLAFNNYDSLVMDRYLKANHTCNVFKHPRISPWLIPTKVPRPLESALNCSSSHISFNRLTKCTGAGFWNRIILAIGRSFVRDDA